MAAQKKTTSSAPKKQQNKQTKQTKQPQQKQQTRQTKQPAEKITQKYPFLYRVLVGLLFVLLSFFSACGYFKSMDAIFINWLCGLFKGLMGYGYYMMPPALLLGAGILMFQKNKPVRLRIVCLLLIPVFFSSFVHLFAVSENPELGIGMFKELWKSGLALHSGGAVAGVMAAVGIRFFSKVGTAFLLILVLFLLCLIVAWMSPMELFRRLRPEPRIKMKEEVPPPQPVQRRAEEKAETKAVRRRASAIDIPMDEEAPFAAPQKPVEEEAAQEPKKEGFFNRISRVKRPDEVLTQAKQPAAPTPAEPAPPPAPAEEVPQTVPVAEEPSAPAMPEIEREPAVSKMKKEEAAKMAEQVAQDIEASLEQGTRTYQYPPVSLLREGSGEVGGSALNELKANQTRLEDTIRSFGIDARICGVVRGPSVTRYELELDQGVRLNKLTNLADDIALALGASGVRIAPIPDKISMVGIEVPNKLVTPVPIHEVISSKEFCNHSSKVAFSVGKDIGGNCIVGNIAKLPHLLIAGTTGSGKSVCTNSLIISLLYKATPDEVRLIMVDPKMVELGIYNGIPHLLIPVVTDPKKAAGALQWAVVEMMKRYRSFSEVGVRDLASYNALAGKTDGMERMPQIVVVIDELADLMLVAAKEVEESICRVAQMGRAAGMHLVIATQRPSADVITGLMKANIPSRISFAVASALESRIILDTTGAEKLVGRGDMLYFPLGSGKPTRVQGCLISDEEVAAVVDFIKKNSGTAQYSEEIIHEIEQHAAEKDKGAKSGGATVSEAPDNDYDELLPAAIEVVLEMGQASVSMLQRRLKLGYGRAARLVDQMEEKGIVGPFEGSKPRQLMITKEQWQEMQFRQGMVDAVPEELDYEADAIPQSYDQAPFDMGSDEL